MTRIDTIVAAATPPGRGGVGIVRVSGPKAPEIAAVILGELPVARRASLAQFLDRRKQPIDVGIALFFPAPHSYTGEDVLELQGHGGPVVMRELLARCISLGARIAARAASREPASIRSAIDSACARSSLSLRKARCVNSPGSARRAPNSNAHAITASTTTEPPCP